MKRKIIHIEEGLCNGCGACAQACHEGAIQMVNGKARLMRDDYCDGLGDCLPTCPTGAITFVEREAAPYDKQAVLQNQARQGGGCPGSRAGVLRPAANSAASAPGVPQASALSQWPVQIKLVPVNAPYFDGSHLLIAADCTAYAYGSFHEDFIRGRVTLIGCPKLDEGDYADKLSEIFAANNVKSIVVARMEVPCCGGIEHAVRTALARSGKTIPWRVVTLSCDGSILENRKESFL